MDSQTKPNEPIIQINYIVGIVCSCLSLAVILSLFVVYLIRPYSKGNVFFRMVIYMELPNALYAITGLFVLPHDLSGEFCVISAAIRQFTNLSFSFWTLAIACHIYSSISVHEIRPFSFYYLLFGYGLPIPFTLVPFFLDMYQRTPIYCGLPYDNPIPNLAVYYIPLLTILIGTCYCYYSVIRYLRRKVSKEAARKFYALFFYPLLIVLYNIGSLAFLLERTYDKTPCVSHDILRVITTGVLQAQGAFDVLVYSQNYAIREEIKSKLCGTSANDLNNEFDPSFSCHLGSFEIKKRRHSTTEIDDRSAIQTRYFSFLGERTRTSITI